MTKPEVNAQLRHYLTPRGVLIWWNNPSWQLNGASPAQAWADGRKQEVYDFAVGGRDMVAT